MNGLPYYKAYPKDFINGTVGMTLELKGAYRIVLDLIYMQGGNLPDDPRYISGVLGCSVRKWNGLRNDLIERGKIQATNGCLTNYRAIIELESLSKFRDKQRENRASPKENNDLDNFWFHHTEPDTDTERTHAYACDADGVSVTSQNIWEVGRDYLLSTGLQERAAKALIGGLISQHNRERAAQGIEAARQAGTQDPAPYIVKFMGGGDAVAEAFRKVMQDAGH